MWKICLGIAVDLLITLTVLLLSETKNEKD